MATRYQIWYSAYGKDYHLAELTEAQARKTFLGIIGNFMNWDMGCLNGLERHYGDIYVDKDHRSFLHISGKGKEAYVSGGKANNSIRIDNWDLLRECKLPDLYKVCSR